MKTDAKLFQWLFIYELFAHDNIDLPYVLIICVKAFIIINARILWTMKTNSTISIDHILQTGFKFHL